MPYVSVNITTTTWSFTTPDRDNDDTPLGTVGSTTVQAGGLMPVFLQTEWQILSPKYRGVPKWVFWGTWPGIEEAQPGGYKSSFKEVKMMIRPKAL